MNKITVLKTLIFIELFALGACVFTANILGFMGWFFLLITDFALLKQEKEKNGNNN